MIASVQCGKILKKLKKELGFKLENYLANNDANAANNAADVNDLMIRMHKVETMVWFDVYRTTSFDAGLTWQTLTYNGKRAQPNFLNSIDTGTGIFTCPMAGIYQFNYQGWKPQGSDGSMRLSLNGVPISYSGNSDDENNASIFGTAIIELVIGDKVWVDTLHKLDSNEVVFTHFTGVMIQQPTLPIAG